MPSSGDGYSFPRIKSKRNKLGWIFSSSASLKKKVGESIWWSIILHAGLETLPHAQYSSALLVQEDALGRPWQDVQTLLGSNMASDLGHHWGLLYESTLRLCCLSYPTLSQASFVCNNSELPLLWISIKHQNRYCFSKSWATEKAELQKDGLEQQQKKSLSHLGKKRAFGKWLAGLKNSFCHQQQVATIHAVKTTRNPNKKNQQLLM